MSKVFESPDSLRRQRALPRLKEGFAFDEDDDEGRGGIIYLKKQERIVEILWESGGYPDYRFFIHFAEPWFWIGSADPLGAEEKADYVQALRLWLWKQGIRSNLEPPENIKVI